MLDLPYLVMRLQNAVQRDPTQRACDEDADCALLYHGGVVSRAVFPDVQKPHIQSRRASARSITSQHRGNRSAARSAVTSGWNVDRPSRP